MGCEIIIGASSRNREGLIVWIQRARERSQREIGRGQQNPDLEDHSEDFDL